MRAAGAARSRAPSARPVHRPLPPLRTSSDSCLRILLEHTPVITDPEPLCRAKATTERCLGVTAPRCISFPNIPPRTPLPVATPPPSSLRARPARSTSQPQSLQARCFSAFKRFLPRRQDDPYDENRIYGRDVPPPQPKPPPKPAEGGHWRASYIAKGLQQEGSSRVVLFAIAANTTVALIKTAAWLHSGSAAMLAEVLHSCADIANQALLFVGIRLATYAAVASSACICCVVLRITLQDADDLFVDDLQPHHIRMASLTSPTSGHSSPQWAASSSAVCLHCTYQARHTTQHTRHTTQHTFALAHSSIRNLTTHRTNLRTSSLPTQCARRPGA